MSCSRVSLAFLAVLAFGCGDSGTAESQGTGTDPGTGPGSGSTGGSETSGGPGTSAGDDTTGTVTPTTSGESSSEGPSCPENAPPAAPEVIEPVPDRIDVIAAELVITASAFSDPDGGDALGGAELEIWRVKGGVVDERVWSAEVVGADPIAVTIADGVFDDGPDGALEAWKDYVVRVRYRDERGECSSFGPWSEDRGFRVDDGSTMLFDDSVVRDIYIDIPPDSFKAIDDEALPPGCVPYTRSYHTGTLRFEGETFVGVGVKTKGGCGTSRTLDQKASFKINLEWDDPEVPGCPAERRLLGQNHLTLNNGVQDHSATHERLGYSLYRDLGVPAPRAASVRVFVNDELWGLYQHVETIDRRFLSRWFGSKEGMLYEGTYWCDLVPKNLPPNDDDDSKCLTREFSPGVCSEPDPDGDPLDYSVLRAFVEQIEALPPGGFYPAIEEFFEFDRYLTTWALESVIGHWDGYQFDIMNNYRVYHDPSTQRWTLLSTGIDQIFDKNQDPWAVKGVIAARCVQEPACEAAFAQRLGEVNDWFAQTDLAGRSEEIFTQVSPYVMEDPRKEYGFNEFVNQHQDLLNFIDDRPGEIAGWLASHGF